MSAPDWKGCPDVAGDWFVTKLGRRIKYTQYEVECWRELANWPFGRVYGPMPVDPEHQKFLDSLSKPA